MRRIVPLLLLLASCSNAPPAVEGPGRLHNGKQLVIVAHHGWHTGIVIPAPSIQSRLPGVARHFGDRGYLEFGWGDKDFYQAREMSSGLAMRAVLWPTDTVVRVLALPGDFPNHLSRAGLARLCVDEQAMEALLDFLASSFARDQGALRTASDGTFGNSRFYEGVGRYHSLNTCNTWTAKALKSMGMDISAASKLTADSVMNYLRRHPGAKTLQRRGESDSARRDDLSCP